MAYVKKINGYDVKDAEAMEKTNPTGTGSFSLNRKADTDIGSDSFAEGTDTTASGNASHAEGDNTTARGNSSHAEGTSTTAEGKYSHAEGQQTTASGAAAHAEGFDTTASGTRSHAEGQSTIASGNLAHAEGYHTTASAHRSHAEGYHTTASANDQHVQGKYNVANPIGTYADIVGWGADEDHRKNISALTTEGDLRLKGKVYINCEDDSTGGTELVVGATDDHINSLIDAKLIALDGNGVSY